MHSKRFIIGVLIVVRHIYFVFSFTGYVSQLHYDRRINTIVATLSVASIQMATPSYEEESENEMEVSFYSPNFHRHIVAKFNGQNYTKILGSFMFLDEVEQKFPNVQRVETSFSKDLEVMHGLGIESLEDYHRHCHDHRKNIQSSKAKSIDVVPASIMAMPSSTGPHFSRMQTVVSRYSAMIGESSFLDSLPDSRRDLFCERIQFFLSPQSPKKLSLSENSYDSNMVVVQEFFHQGYGVGLTTSQMIFVLAAFPHFLEPNPSEALRLRTPAPTIVARLGVRTETLEAAQKYLNEWLDEDSFADAAAFAALSSQGVTWEQCAIMINAFSSSMITCEMERIIQIFDADPLRREPIEYLRSRYQILPSQVVQMLRLHTRLSTYSINVLKEHSDALQIGLNMSSQTLKELVRRRPSLLGPSSKKTQERILFLQNRLHMSSSQLQKVLLQEPSILQASIENNLEPKIVFLEETIGMTSSNLTNIILRRPRILVASLEKGLKPTVTELQSFCGLSRNDTLAILLRNPVVLTSKWNTILKPKLQYLKQRNCLEKEQLRAMVMISPNILSHSITKSLEPKMRLLETAAGLEKGCVPLVVRENPSLLSMSIQDLKKRIALMTLRNSTFVETFSSTKIIYATDEKKSVRTRRKRPVLELQNGSIMRSFSDIQKAAEGTGTSRANMYHILSTGRIFKGNTYEYGSIPSLLNVNYDMQTSSLDEVDSSSSLLDEKQAFHEFHRFDTKLRRKVKDENLEAIPSASVYIPIFATSATCVVSGKSGNKFANGLMAIFFPSLESPRGKQLLHQSAKRLNLQVLREDDDTKEQTKGILLSHFPAAKATRNRCTLLATRNALRLAAELVGCDFSLRDSSIHVDVITDSSFVSELMRNFTSVLEWGSYENLQTFEYSGTEPQWRVHPDILYPVARTCYRVYNQQFDVPTHANRKENIAANITIRFLHESELAWIRDDPMVAECQPYTARILQQYCEKIWD